MRVHFIGIGGYGMSGLAELWHRRGFTVTGSDAKASSRTRRLESLGIPVFLGHRPEQVVGADVVVYTTDVREDNPELAEARRRGTVVRHRSDLLAELLNGGEGIAVTGTHGKTTTTLMVGTVLLAAGLDPTVVVGAEVEAFGGGAHLGVGPHVVAEADESDGSFLKYQPKVAVVTNIEPEHLDHYGGSFARVLEAFRAFAEGIRPGGFLVASAEDPEAAALRPRHVPVLHYGLQRGRYRARDIVPEGMGQRFRFEVAGREVGEVRLRLPGRHNVQNALAALAVADGLSLSLETAIEALAHFRNARRRFETHYRRDGIQIVDDYAHHPSEIQAVLAAARSLQPRRLIALFQPQRYQRTALLMDAFTKAFDQADLVFLTEIYAPPGEAPIPGVSGAELARRVAARLGERVRYVPTLEEAERAIAETIEAGDLILTMGAGDVYRVAEGLSAALERLDASHVPDAL